MPTTAVAEKKKWPKWENQAPLEKKNYLKELLDKLMPDFDLLLQKKVDPNVLIYAVLNSFNKTPKLQECNLNSIMRSIVYLAQIQLMPDTPDQHAHLIPFGKECTVIINYQGYIELAHRSERVAWIYGELVYSNDEYFVQRGTDPKIVHKPFLSGDRGQIIGAYAVAKLTNGQTQFEPMSMTELNKIRNISKSKDIKGSPWQVWPEPMYKKIPIRQLKKVIPTTPALALAVALDNASAGDDSQEGVAPIPAKFTILDEDDGNGSSRQSKSDKLADDLDDKPEPEKKADPPKKEKPKASERSKRTDPRREKEGKPGKPAEADPPVTDRKQREADFLSYIVEHEDGVKTFMSTYADTYSAERVAELKDRGLEAAFGYVRTMVEDYYAKQPKGTDAQPDGKETQGDLLGGKPKKAGF